ncbi:MAG: hypothetical protein R3C10_23465 [Pirellulales bacterium]
MSVKMRNGGEASMDDIAALEAFIGKPLPQNLLVFCQSTMVRSQARTSSVSEINKTAIAQDFRTVAGAGIMVPEGGPKDGRTNEAEASHVQR